MRRLPSTRPPCRAAALALTLGCSTAGPTLSIASAGAPTGAAASRFEDPTFFCKALDDGLVPERATVDAAAGTLTVELGFRDGSWPWYFTATSDETPLDVQPVMAAPLVVRASDENGVLLAEETTPDFFVAEAYVASARTRMRPGKEGLVHGLAAAHDKLTVRLDQARIGVVAQVQVGFACNGFTSARNLLGPESAVAATPWGGEKIALVRRGCGWIHAASPTCP